MQQMDTSPATTNVSEALECPMLNFAFAETFRALSEQDQRNAAYIILSKLNTRRMTKQ